MFHSRKTRGLAAATLILTATPVAMADVTGAYVVRYTVTAEDFDGTEVTVNVADIYLSSDDPNDTVLNAYDLSIADAGKVPYFQSSAGTGWLPNNAGGLFDTAAVRSADSFITVGGFAQGVTFPEQTPGAGTGSGIDPNFGGNDTDYPGDLAGWFNGSPPSLNGQVGQIARPDGGFGLGVLIGRFSYAGPFNLNGSNLSVTWNQGLGTPGQQQLFVMSDFVDCNANGIPDDQDILDGTSADCDGSFVPDECEIADGTAPDCNQNGIPDQCEINEGTAGDCNENGVPDDCDVADLANDYNQNGVPDSCEGLTVPGDFESIADAITTAPVGSVVFVEPGIYEQPIVLDRAVAIVAADGPETTKLDGSKSLGPVLIIDGAPAGAVLAGFTIRAGDPSGEHPMGGGIVGVDSFATIADCVIVGNTGMEGGGLRFEGFGFPVVVGCEIRNNLSYGPGGGVYGPEFRVEDCTIESNISLEGVGHAIASSNAWVYDSTIRNHDADGTVVDQGSWIGLGEFGMRVRNCLIEDNAGTASYGVGEVEDSIIRNNGGNGVADATVIQNCTITGNSGDGVFAAFGGIFDSTISGNGGVGFRGTIDPQYFIDNTVCGNTEGALAGMTNDELLEFGVDNIILDDRCPDLVVPDDADTIQLAIDTSIDGERIVVRPGEYPGFELIGRDVEILSSEGKATTTIANVYFDGSNDPAVMVIRGFTIRATEGLVPVPAVFADGSLRIEASTITGGGSSGVVARGGMPQLIDTEVTGNSDPSSGGGIRIESASLMLERVLVSGNSIPLATESRGGGVYVEGGAELILIDTTICDNARENLANFGVVSDQGGNTICLANDCDGNGIEDASDIGDLGRPDCDGNLVPDDCDLADGAADCDGNGIIDSCQIADGSSDDCNENGVPDECEINARPLDLIFAVDTTGSMEDDLSLLASGIAEITAILSDDDRIGLIEFKDDAIVTVPMTSDISSFTSTFTSIDASGGAEGPEASDEAVKHAAAAPTSCVSGSLGELRGNADKVLVLFTDNEAGGCTDAPLPSGAFEAANAAAAAGIKVIAIAERSAPLDQMGDYATITGGVLLVGATSDLPTRVAEATESLRTPDPASADCDGNGILDECELADGSAIDCDGNGAIDSCEIAADPGLDCDDDGILDSCELADGTAPDINQNGVHDACESQLVFNVPSTFTTIASAFAVAPDGSVIGLDPGVYTEPIDFADRNLVIRGDLDDPSAVVIDGSAAPASIVTFAGGQTSDAGLQGLTVTGGTMGTPLPGQPTSLAGGAVFVNGCSPHFDRVIFRDNVAGFGGGVYALGGDSTYVDCVFRNNFASTDGGGFMSFDSNAEVRGCVFDDNRAVNDGGATKIARGQALIADCEIFENQATEGGGIYFFSNPDTVPLRIEGTSVTNNLATKFGGGIKARFGLPGFTILDSIMCDNQPDSIVGDYEDLGGNTLCVCPCDLNGDGLVNGVDLGLYLGYQSTCIPGEYCPIDFDGDGVITGGDLGLLLGFWGLCP